MVLNTSYSVTELSVEYLHYKCILLTDFSNIEWDGPTRFVTKVVSLVTNYPALKGEEMCKI
jgi:hypothetical protein